jgi:hypothetical protein
MLTLAAWRIGQGKKDEKVCCCKASIESEWCPAVSILFLFFPEGRKCRVWNGLGRKFRLGRKGRKQKRRLTLSEECASSLFENSRRSVANLSLTLLLLLLLPQTHPERPQVASSFFLAYNTALVPPYRVLIDTNFINFSLQNKLELMEGMMDCLYASVSLIFYC